MPILPFRSSRRALPSPAAAGFTAVELLVAVAVVAVLSGLGAASYRDITGRTRAAGAAADLLHAVELTRSEALKRGARVTLLPAAGDWTAGWMVFVDSNANRRWDPGEPVILRHEALAPSTRLTANTTPGYIAFGAGGMPQQYSGAFLAATLSICDAGSGRSLVLARSGRPRMVSATC